MRCHACDGHTDGWTVESSAVFSLSWIRNLCENFWYDLKVSRTQPSGRAFGNVFISNSLDPVGQMTSFPNHLVRWIIKLNPTITNSLSSNSTLQAVFTIVHNTGSQGARGRGGRCSIFSAMRCFYWCNVYQFLTMRFFNFKLLFYCYEQAVTCQSYQLRLQDRRLVNQSINQSIMYFRIIS